MNGVHDMGGAQGFGPVRPETDEPMFHAAWERRALALTLAMGATGQWNIDMSRSRRESMPPADYLGRSYYEIWLAGLQALMLERGMATASELASGELEQPGVPLSQVLQPAQVAPALARGSPTQRTPGSEARFKPGDRVRALNMHPQGHTRLPRYVRGHAGVVTLVHGAHVFADRHAGGLLPPFDQRPEWLYTVVFEGRTLWGAQADPGLEVSVDAWEPYLEAAP
jgi:nitrile hydratase